jgi:hypothetical protein
MRGCVCLQGDVANVPAGRLADDLRKQAPVFFFFDPSGKLLGKLEGTRRTSTSEFMNELKELWTASFDSRLRDFTRKMTSNLDKLEKLERKLISLEIKRSRARGSASRLRSIDREEAKIEKEEKELLDAQKELVGELKVKDEFLTK